MLTLDEIAIAFKNCNGESNDTFKDYLLSKNIAPEDYKTGIILAKAFNSILSDIEILLDKSIINICAADNLNTKGIFHWGFVSSYYSNFFSIQALNRLKLNFHVWSNSNILCKYSNYVSQELTVTKKDNSGNSHELQFHQYFENYKNFKTGKGIDRYWNIGLYQSKDGIETALRNEINYALSKENYYELTLGLSSYQQIVRDNTKSPFLIASPSISNPYNYSYNNLQLGMSRLRMVAYILNYVANRNIEYRSYFQRNMARRRKSIEERLCYTSEWCRNLLNEWLKYENLSLELDTVTVPV